MEPARSNSALGCENVFTFASRRRGIIRALPAWNLSASCESHLPRGDSSIFFFPYEVAVESSCELGLGAGESGLRKNLIDGVTMSDKTIEMITPPITAIAKGCNICDPAPKANASGSIPAIVANGVMTVGRKPRGV